MDSAEHAETSNVSERAAVLPGDTAFLLPRALGTCAEAWHFPVAPSKKYEHHATCRALAPFSSAGSAWQICDIKSTVPICFEAKMVPTGHSLENHLVCCCTLFFFLCLADLPLSA